MTSLNSVALDSRGESMTARASRYVARLFFRALPHNRVFHNLRHTYDVVRAALIIAEAEGFDKQQVEVLTLAALFHDSGHTQVYQDHELASMAIARDWLSEQQYAPERLAMVLDGILATRMPQAPQNDIQSALCDADLYHLSLDNYPAYEARLRTEWREALHLQFDSRTWILSNQSFLDQHQYFTKYGRQVLEPAKRQRMQDRASRISSLLTDVDAEEQPTSSSQS